MSRLNLILLTVVLANLGCRQFQAAEATTLLAQRSPNSVTTTSTSSTTSTLYTSTSTSSTTSTSPSTTPSTTPTTQQPPDSDYHFEFPETFTSTQAEPGTSYRLNLPANTPLRRIRVQFEIFNGGWNTTTVYNPETQENELKHVHGIFWLTQGRRWNGGVVSWTSAKESQKKIKVGSNIGLQGAGTEGNDAGYGPVFLPGEWYSVNYVYDAPANTTDFTLSAIGRAGTVRVISPTTSNSGTLISVDPYYQLNFGHETSGPGGGPEAGTYGWKIRDLVVDFYR